MAKDNLQFQTEVQQLLQLMIHSVYSNKDIFVRELVANAADALDKARFESISRPELAREWEIRIAADPKAGTISVSDNGIGMTRDEVVENLRIVNGEPLCAGLFRLEILHMIDGAGIIGFLQGFPLPGHAVSQFGIR